MTPMLDLLRACPSELAQCEYNGIAQTCLDHFFTIVLSDKAHTSFLKEFRSLKLPPGWGRLQNPLTHLVSYRMSELARLAVVPALLRCWLRDDHLMPRLVQ